MSELSEHKEPRQPQWYDNPQNPWEVMESIMSLGYGVIGVIHIEPRKMVLNDRS